jgi:hypothetical protein
MEFAKIKDDFLSTINDGDFYDGSRVTYKRKLDVFYEYLSDICGVNDKNYKEFITGLGSDKIIDSIRYYVEEKDIKCKITIENYVTVIKAYFDYLSKINILKNVNFDSKIEFEKVKVHINNEITKLKLKDVEGKCHITDAACKKLINYCDEIIDDFNIEEINIEKLQKQNSWAKTYNLFLSAFICKVLIITGLKNNEIGKIKINDYEPQLNIMTINSFRIHLPDRLGIQFRKYIKMRDKIVNANDEQILFVNKFGNAIGKDYNVAFCVLKELFDSHGAEIVSKCTIINLIKKGTNINMLKDLTGFGENTFLYCQDVINEEKNKEDACARNRHIDSKIRSLEVFDLL